MCKVPFFCFVRPGLDTPFCLVNTLLFLDPISLGRAHAKLRLGPLPATLAILAVRAFWSLVWSRSIHIVRVVGLSRHWENKDMILRKHRKPETRRVIEKT